MVKAAYFSRAGENGPMNVFYGRKVAHKNNLYKGDNRKILVH